jgi:DUF3102 family protein
MKTLPVLIRKINEGHKLVGSSVDRACEVGKWLIEAKKQVQHGQWRSWQKKNLKFAIRTAQVYMASISHLPTSQARSTELPTSL